ncbi:MAG TPA: PQQ-binding-like beta-propeller repeat protein [Candidatus Acidoferrales bacterium]|nr:PQQ-binding-like beta-propeller repeat protein [Candidatus Saccharimonadales bacterium]HVC05240.1 PQQ-binding-like beta-propeller repeat protein [Candidatus Acidoferrales bacterium]
MKHLTLTVGSAAALVASILGATGGAHAAASTTAANWTQVGVNAQHTGDNTFETVITRSNVSHLKHAFETKILTGPDPIVANGVVYLGDSADGYVQAIDAASGAVDWTRDACNTGAETTAPAFAAGKVWVGLDDPGTAALSVAGASVGCFESDLYTSPPSAAGGVVYAGGTDGIVVAINATTRKILWQRCLQCSPSGGPSLATPAVSADGSWLYIGSSTSGDVYKLNAATGALVWTHYVDSCGESAVAVSGSSLFVSGCAVYALSATTGAQLWHSTKIGSTISMPAVADGLVYVTAGGNYSGTFALNASTGKTMWSEPEFLGPLYPPTIANGVVYVDFPEISSLVMYDSTTGAQIGSLGSPLAREFTGSATVVNGRVYIVSFNFESDTAYKLEAYQP